MQDSTVSILKNVIQRTPKKTPTTLPVMAPRRALVLAKFSWLILSALSSHASIDAPSAGSLSLSFESYSQDEGPLPVRSGDARPLTEQVSQQPEDTAPEGPLPSFGSQGPAPLSIDAPVTVTPLDVLPPLSGPLLPSKRRRTWLLLSMGAVSGLAHVSCWFNYDFYANMMTGNSIRGTLAASRGDAHQALFFAAVVLSYLLGASIYRVLDLFLLSQSSDLSGAAQEAAGKSQFDRHKLRNLAWTSPLSLAVFCASDVAYRWMRRRASATAIMTIMIRLSSLAIGFGMVNAAAQESLNTVTNAATGHITRLGLGVVDRALLWRVGGGRKTAGLGSERVRPVSPVVAAARSSAEPTSTSCLFLAVLISSLAVSSVASRRRWIPLDELDPVLGTLFGALYATLLFWYTFPFVEPPWSLSFRIAAHPRINRGN